MQVIPYCAEYVVAAAERKRGVRPVGRRCARKNGKSDLQVALPALSRPPVQTVLALRHVVDFASVGDVPKIQDAWLYI
jgi:hypothetical protein